MNLAGIIQVLQREIGLNPASISEGAVRHAMQRRMVATGCQSSEAYQARLDASRDEVQELIEEVTVPETWFFREDSAFECLRQQARQTQANNQSGRPFSVASIPCATGEEPYSIAMALFDMGMAASRFRVHALDVSFRALLLAQQARYGSNSFRAIDNSFRQRFFEMQGNAYGLHESVKAQVSFYQGSVTTLPAPFNSQTYDVVFTRNLLIYLDHDGRERFIAGLKRMLAPTAILLVGHSEAGILLNAGFVRRADGAFVQADAQARTVPVVAIKLPRLPSIPVLTKRKRAPVSPSAMPFSSDNPTSPQRSHSAATTAVELPVAVTDALDEVRQLADAGRLQEAQARCEQLLASGQHSAQLHYLRGLLHNAQGDSAAARECYRKAVYLDPQHGEAKAQLTLLLTRSSETTAQNSSRGQS